MLSEFRPGKYLAPRYWLIWVGFGLLWLETRLPYRLQMRIGSGLGILLYYFMSWRRRIAQINIGLCFPERPPAEQMRLVKDHFRSIGMSILETGLCWWGKEEKLRPLDHVQGLDYLLEALQKGKGAILLSAHFTSLEISGRFFIMHHPVRVMYKKHRNSLFEAVMKGSREKYFPQAVQRHDVRGMLRSLKANMPIWYAPDQDLGARQSVFVPFMGIPAATLTATSRLAKMSGAPVVPYFMERLRDGSGYLLTFYPPLEGFPSGDDKQDALRINQIIEKQVRKVPEQYLWAHRRFKTRPEGEPSLYPERRRKRKKRKT
jgi:KDO2-lipid IV(A) lauroyltransferase